MHQVGDAGNRLGLDAERLELVGESPVDLGGRWDREARGMVLVEHQAHVHSAFGRGLKRSEDRGPGSGRQPEVVDRDVERLRRPSRRGAMRCATTSADWPPSVRKKKSREGVTGATAAI